MIGSVPCDIVSQTGSNLQSAESSFGCFDQTIASFFDSIRIYFGAGEGDLIDG